ncbi:MAG: calcium-binding protein [Acidobacteriia bacterium]|nr:calcium-binding protein [Terriglobia bacterium]
MLRIAIEDACSGDMLTLVRWYSHNQGVSLSQLARVDAYESTAEAIADWHYLCFFNTSGIYLAFCRATVQSPVHLGVGLAPSPGDRAASPTFMEACFPGPIQLERGLGCSRQ